MVLQRMKGKFALASLIVGYLLHVADVALDVYVAIQYCIREEWWWFSLTLIFIVLPVIIQNFGICVSPLRSFIAVSMSYRDAFRKWKDQNWDNTQLDENESREKRKTFVESARILAEMRYVETMAESAPQWCLQTYVMLRQWFFPWYTILSTFFSLLSLAWSITTLEKAEKLYDWYIKRNEHRNYPTMPIHLTFFSWQLCALVPRLSALVIFGYAFRYHVFVVMGLHWLLCILASCILQKNESEDEQENCMAKFGFLLYCTCISYPITIHISGNTIKLVFGETFKYRRQAVTFYYILLSVENIVLVCLAVWATPAKVTHMGDLRTPVLLLVFICLAGATMFMILYYCFHHPAAFAREAERENNVEQPNRHAETENQAFRSSLDLLN